MNNLLVSELQEHRKLLDAFRELPADLKRLVQTFYVSAFPTNLCKFCQWRVTPPYWSARPICYHCFCHPYLPGPKKRIIICYPL